MKKIFRVILIVAILLIVVFIIRGSEDTWICDNGEWVKHGVPNASKPTEPCN
jgi:hypothetical protein